MGVVIQQGRPLVKRQPSELQDAGRALCLAMAEQPHAPLVLAWVQVMDADSQPCPWAASWGAWLAAVQAGRWGVMLAEQAARDAAWEKEPPLPF